MKLAIITDTHFGARNDNLNFNDYFFKFYDNVFFPTLEERGITTCVHMGDVVDRRKYISYRIANDFRERFVNRFKEMGIDLHIIIGNHDTYYKNTSEVNSMEELVGSDRFKIYTGPEVVESLTAHLFCLFLGSTRITMKPLWMHSTLQMQIS